MIWDTIFFVILPYIAIAVAVTVTFYRAFYRPFTVSSMSSQLLERKKLYWGSISFHYGIVLVLIGHLISLFLPEGLRLFYTVPIRLYILQLTGLTLGIWSMVGLSILLWRRLSEKRVRVVSTPMDIIVLILLLVSVISGVLVSSLYRFGTFWFTAIFTPYLLSLFKFQPLLSLVAPLPLIIKLHVFNFFLLLAVFPFSRLVHIITYPIGYLIRPWQIVIWNRKIRSAALPRTQGD